MLPGGVWMGFIFPREISLIPLCRDLGSIPENTAAEWSMAMVVVTLALVVAIVVPEEERHHVMAYLSWCFFPSLARPAY